MDLKNKINIVFLIGIFLLVFLFLVTNYSQQKPAASSGELKFYIDNAAFKGEKDKTYFEFYLMIYADQLEYVSKENKKCGTFKVNSVATNIKTGKQSIKTWVTDAQLQNDSVNSNSLVYYDQWAEMLEPGNYEIFVNIEDQNSLKSGEAKYSVTIPSMNKNEFSASQIEFASKINNEFTNPNFKKGNKNVIPNPSRRYGILNPVMYFYYELYDIAGGKEDTLNINYFIEDNSGSTVKNLDFSKTNLMGKTSAVMHGINVSDLPSGIYNLKINLLDKTSKKSTTLSRSFEIIQADYLNNNKYLTAEQAETAENYLKYIATSSEFETYKSLNQTGKAEFLIRFWKQHDPSPSTEENEYLEDIQKRYLFSNENFSWGKIKGWATDRGRVLIQYGMPDNIERHHSEAETIPYEIWTYQQDKQYIFVFVDSRQNGQFGLVHSTAEGEAQNYYWRELIIRL